MRYKRDKQPVNKTFILPFSKKLNRIQGVNKTIELKTKDIVNKVQLETRLNANNNISRTG